MINMNSSDKYKTEMESKRKRMVITGASGFLGSRLYEFFSGNQFSRDYLVFAPTHTQMDITDKNAVQMYMKEIHPDIVIHSAAVSNTWICQQQPELSWNVNVEGTINIGRICHELGSRIIFMSSDQVYNGEAGLLPHLENEVLTPSNIYGKHKLEAEQRLCNMEMDVVCLRLTWMFDYPKEGRVLNQNIIVNVLNALKQQTSIQSPIYEYRGVTNVWDVVKNMENVLDIPAGIYNYGSECSGNTYETVGFVFDSLGKNMEKEKLLLADTKRYVNQPRNLSMSIEKLKKTGISFPSSYEGILQCIKESN